MLRPMMVAPESTIASTSALFSSDVSNIQACNQFSSMSPNGASSRWFSPAA